MLLFENSNFALYSDFSYNPNFILRFTNYFEKKKDRILNFYGIESFRKINIHLYISREEYISFLKDKGLEYSAYSKGRCLDSEIHFTCEKEILDEFPKVGYSIASIMHEFVHLVYYEKVNKNRVILVDEGLAHYLSGQKSFLEENELKYNSWFKEKIISKEIPKFEYLLNHGGTYGKFVDTETLKYNGYDIGYAFVRYIIDTCNEDEKKKVLIYQDIVEVEKYYNKFKEYVESKK